MEDSNGDLIKSLGTFAHGGRGVRNRVGYDLGARTSRPSAIDTAQCAALLLASRARIQFRIVGANDPSPAASRTAQIERLWDCNGVKIGNKGLDTLDCFVEACALGTKELESGP